MLRLYKWVPLGAFLLLFFPQLQAQRVILGGHAGFSLGVFRSSGVELLSAGTLPGPVVGFTVGVPFVKRLLFQTELNFVQSNGNSVINQYSKDTRTITGIPIPVDVRVRVNSRINLYAFELPLLIKYQYIKKEMFNMTVYGGPVFTGRFAYTLAGEAEVNIKGIPFQDIDPNFAQNGFNENTEVLVSRGSIPRDTVRYSRWDAGIMVGLGSAIHMKFGTFTMDFRYVNNFTNINIGPVQSSSLYTGNVQILFGFEWGVAKRQPAKAKPTEDKVPSSHTPRRERYYSTGLMNI
jgi:hypothetical protein